MNGGFVGSIMSEKTRNGVVKNSVFGKDEDDNVNRER